jgi:DNA polymerase beta thumb
MVEIFGVDAFKFVEQDERPEGETVDLHSEEDIFRFLNMEYVHPSQRMGY